MHIAFNLAMWWYLASQTEQRLGTGKLFVIMLCFALFSNWAQSLFTDSNFGGLSGVVLRINRLCRLNGKRNPEKGIVLQQA